MKQRSWLAAAIVTVVAGCSAPHATRSGHSAAPCAVPQVVAHRGAHTQATENTVEAIDAAERLGVYGVEVDVQTSTDGVPVLVHDDSVGRTTDGSGQVSSLTWPELDSVGVDRLSAALAALEPDTLMLLEIKAPESSTEVTRIVRTVQGSDKNIVIESFDRDIVAQVVQMGADAGLIASEPDEPKLDVQVYSPGEIPQSPVDARVMVWTLDEASQWQAATDAGIDAVLTNRPAAALSWRTHACKLARAAR